jgi:Rrf2 family protein
MNDLRTLLKREESYAVHALINIAENPGTNAAEIAERLKMPAAFLAKVMRKLVNAGFVESQTGRSGGVSLRVSLAELSILEVIEAVSGSLILDTCQVQKRCANQQRKGRCNLKVAWIGATLGIREVLGGVKLAQLCDTPVVT